MATDESLNRLFGRIVAERRAQMGISQERLALNAELDRTFVGKVEQGKHSPSLGSLFKLAQGLGMTPDELVRELRERRMAEEAAGKAAPHTGPHSASDPSRE